MANYSPGIISVSFHQRSKRWIFRDWKNEALFASVSLCEEDALRIVKCWNVCKDIEDPTTYVESLKREVTRWKDLYEKEHNDFMDAASGDGENT